MGNQVSLDPLSECMEVDRGDPSPISPYTMAERDSDQLRIALMESLHINEEDHALHLALAQSRETVETRPSPQDVGVSQEQDNLAKLERLLGKLGLRRLDVGSMNVDEYGNNLSNQCFYLSIARSWLAHAAAGSGMLVRDSALQLKRWIEASVLEVRGEAALDDLGEEAEAFADYLACALCSEESTAASAITKLAVIIFASSNGTLDVYEGRGYALQKREERVTNLAIVWHRPGHFEAVVADTVSGKVDLTLNEILVEAAHCRIPLTKVRS